jgi:hypothetical protein
MMGSMVSGTLTGATPPQTRFVSPQEMASGELPTDLVERLKRTPLVDFAQYPQLKGMSSQLTRLTQETTVAMKESGDYFVVLFDDIQPNAFFSRTKSGQKIIGVSLGMLSFAKNDDELAYVIGHEIKHGSAALQVKADAARQAGSLDHFLLQRTVENEVDLKSIYEGMLKTGHNPYAARDLVHRLRDTFGDGISITHSVSSNRGKSIDALNLYLDKVEGRRFDLQARRSSRLTPEVKAYLKSSEFLAVQEQRFLADPAHQIRTEIQQAYSDIAQGRYGSPVSKYEEHPLYTKLYKQKMAVARKRYPLIDDPGFEVDLSARMHAEVTREFIAARDEFVVKHGFPKSPEGIAALRGLEQRKYWNSEDVVGSELKGSMKPDPVTLKAAQQKYAADIRTGSKQLQSAKTAYEKRAIQSKMVAQIKKAKAHKELYAQIIATYQPGTDALVEKALKNYDPLASTWKGSVPFDLFDRINANNKYTGKFYAKDRDFLERLNDQIGKLDLSRVSEDLRGSLLSTYWYHRETIRPDFEKWVDTLAPAVALQLKELQAQSTGHLGSYERRRLQINTSRLLSGLKDEIPHVLNSLAPYPRATARFNAWLRQGAQILVDAAEDTEELLSVMDRIIDKKGEIRWDVQNGTMKLPPEQHKAVWNEEMVDRLNRKLARLIGQDLADSTKLASLRRQYLETDLAHLKAGAKPVELPKFSLGELERILNHHMNYLQARTHAQMLYLSNPSLFREKINLAAGDIRRIINSTAQNAAQYKDAISFDQLHQIMEANRIPKSELFEIVTAHPGLFDFNPLAPYDQYKSIPTHEVARNLELRNELLQHVYQNSKLGLKEIHDAFPVFYAPSAITLSKSFEPGGLGPEERAVQARVQVLERDWSDYTFKKFLDQTGHGDVQSIQKALGQWQNQYRGTMEDRFVEHLYFKNFEPDLLGKKLPPQNQESVLQFLTAWRGHSSSKRLDKLLVEFFNTPEGMKYPTQNLEGWIDFFTVSTSPKARSEVLDTLFDHLWAQTEKHPLLRARFNNPTLVQGLKSDYHKLRLAKWQLEEKFKLTAIQKAQKANRASMPAKETLRPIVTELKEEIIKMVPEHSVIRDHLAGYAEERLITTPAEEEVLSEIKTNVRNWTEHSALRFFDAPEMLVKSTQSAEQRLQIIEYLIDRKAQPMTFLANHYREHVAGTSYEVFLTALRDSFDEADPVTRAFFIHPLLDGSTGALSEAPLRREIEERILGKYADDIAVSAFFRGYLKGLPPGQEAFFLSHALASLRTKTGAAAGMKLSSILQSMGPFGARVAQILRSSGYARGEMAKDLDTFFDNAFPVTRTRQINDAKRIFGDNYKHVVSIEELAGVGSVNKVQILKVRGPSSGKVLQVTLKYQDAGVGGQALNEDRNWSHALSELKQNQQVMSDTKMRRLVRAVEEVKETAIESLRPGGEELDLSFERNRSQLAEKAYRTERSTTTGYLTRSAQPVDEIQALIQPEFQTTAAVYEYIDQTPLTQIKDKTLREGLALQMARNERIAILSGTFDSDGHIANRLITTADREIVRIDYAKIHTYPADEVATFKKLVSNLLLPKPGQAQTESVGQAIESAFRYNQKVSPRHLQEATFSALQQADFPTNLEVDERIFYLREYVENELVRLGYPKIEVSLSRTTRNSLVNLAKTMQLREHAPGRQFLIELAEDFGLHPHQLATQEMIRTEVRQRITRFGAKLSGGTHCFIDGLKRWFVRRP